MDIKQGNAVIELFLLFAPIYLANGKLHQGLLSVKLPICPGKEASTQIGYLHSEIDTSSECKKISEIIQ
ncbi:unnamed protein product [Callosobruchus maculatus]|uniref:Uncharacterized protein n=1 Tax=Callosobruchus maculatus TaxID=64391 RepID=A0A653BQW2_CALMS|nr:unnamed protein product [Callosobruchus maculatus]